MQFIADGPDIPLAVLEAHEDHCLVLFCGAGISKANGLPLFSGLVERVREGLGAEWSSLEKQELDNKNYDRVLGLLEAKERYSPAQVRQEVSKILAIPEKPELKTHWALIDLATAHDRERRIRLVTTNFDLLFEEAGSGLPVSSAPLLPVPKPDKWNSLVHLHGCLDDQEPNGVNLVLTSADFGIAYLVERWASRFVSELFRHFTVLFVGYSANDPVMRYLMDALAAERRGGHQIRDAFALASYRAKNRDEEETEWRAKNIEPVLYPETKDHAVLHQTLMKWAADWRGGLTSRLNIVTDLGTKDPAKLPPEAVSRFCWALRHGSGAMARSFADLGTEGPLAWLPVLEQEGLLAGPPGEQNPQSVPLVDYGQATREPPALGPVTGQLSRWLASHVRDPELARWALDKGAHLHSDFVRHVQYQLNAEEAEIIPEALSKIWRALTGSVVLQSGEDAFERLALWPRLQKKEPWSPTLRLDLLTALGPCLALRSDKLVKALKKIRGAPADESNEISVSEVVSFECKLLAGDNTETLLEDLRARSDFGEILLDVAVDLTALLRRALDMMACLDGASQSHDASYSAQPSVAPHEKNRHLYQWTRLIALVREAFDLACEREPLLARVLVRGWVATPYPIFRRLALYAAEVSSALTKNDILQIILPDARHWLWPFHIRANSIACCPSSGSKSMMMGDLRCRRSSATGHRARCTAGTLNQRNGNVRVIGRSGNCWPGSNRWLLA